MLVSANFGGLLGVKRGEGAFRANADRYTRRRMGGI